jgi:hypothetical protein
MKFSSAVITILSLSTSLSSLSSSSGVVNGQSVKVGTCTEEVPCEECTGDCNSDTDCVDDLVCFHQYGRGNKEEGDRVTIPGCNMIGTYIHNTTMQRERKNVETSYMIHTPTHNILFALSFLFIFIIHLFRFLKG